MLVGLVGPKNGHLHRAALLYLFMCAVGFHFYKRRMAYMDTSPNIVNSVTLHHLTAM